MFKSTRASILACLGVFLMFFVGFTACTMKDVLDEAPDKKSSAVGQCTYDNLCTTVGEFCVEPTKGHRLECDPVTFKYRSACKVGYFCDRALTSGQFPSCNGKDDSGKPIVLVCDPLKSKLFDPLMSDGGPDAAADTTSIAETGPADAGPGDTSITETGPADTGPADTTPVDTGSADTAAADSGPAADTSLAADTGPVATGAEASPAESGSADAGASDTSLADAGPTDTGPDTIVTDAGPTETGLADTGATDTSAADTGAADAPASDGGPETIADTSSDVLIIPSCTTAPAGRITAIFTSPVPRPTTLVGTIGFKMWTKYPPATLPDVKWDDKPRCLAPASSVNTMSCDLGPTVSSAKTYFIAGNVKVVTDAEFSTWYMNRDDTTGVRTMSGSLVICNGTTVLYGPSSILSTSGPVRWSDEVDPITGLFRANVLVMHP